MDLEEHKGEWVPDEPLERGVLRSSLIINLFPHQITSVYDLEKLEREKKRDLGYKIMETTMGVFGDAPGHGKSLSMIAVIDRDEMEWDLETPFQYEEIEAFGPSSTYIVRRKIKKEKLDCTLIVASNSLIGQWEKELKRAKKISFHTVTKKKHMEIDPNDYHVVLCSDTMYNGFIDQFHSFAWKRFVFDEAASTHIPSMKTVYAGFYWFITATFPNLSKIRGRNQHFIKTIFSSISPVTFGYMLVKNDDDYVKSSYYMPEPVKVSHKCIQPGVLEVVGDMVGGDIAAMIAAGHIDGAIKHLGGEDDGPRNIIEVVTSNKKEELERAEEKVEEHYPSRKKDSAHKERYKMWVDRVVEIKEKLATIKKRFEKILEDDCSICTNKLENPVLLPCCQNIVCSSCIHEWLSHSPTCHMCRAEVKVGSLISVTDKKAPAPIVFEEDDDEEDEMGDEEEEKGDRKPRELEVMKDDGFVEVKGKKKSDKKKKGVLSKAETIVQIINDKPDGKFIVFSGHDESFDLIKKSFKDNDTAYVEIKGGRESREKKLAMYQTGDVNTIFLNAKFNGAGINLEMTTDIIIYHDMDPLVEIQLIGRANRVGRVGALTIHYLE